MNENLNDCHQQETTCTFIYVREKKGNVFIYTNSMTISLTFLYTKSMILYVAQFFMKYLKLAFIYKKHDTLRYVPFLYTKIRTLCKKQDNLRCIFIYKIRTLCFTRFLIKFLKLAEVGGIFYIQNAMHYALYFYMGKTIHFELLFIQKA